MKDSMMKWVYAFLTLLLTFGWAVFAVCLTWRAVQFKANLDIISAAGVDVLLGALIVWNGNINQHYFRKSKPEDNERIK